jgi:hypothetical protein
MPFPDHIAAVLDLYGIAPDTKAALYDLYVSLGAPAIEAFADVAESIGTPSQLTPDHLLPLRKAVIERYLRRAHPQWLEGLPSASLWHPRELEGRAAGLATPLGTIAASAPTEFSRRLEETVRRILPEGQPIPAGMVMLGRNGHYGGRSDTVSFDVVAHDLEDAIAVAHAEGQQHTMPGSAGETSGTIDSAQSIALIWEIQPNVYKPAGDRNRGIAKVYRRHRNWHVLTLTAALQWLHDRNFATFIVRGDALAAAHEVNAAKPVPPEVVAYHDRTVEHVVTSLGYALAEPSGDEQGFLLESSVMNTGLRKLAEEQGIAGAIRRVIREE